MQTFLPYASFTESAQCLDRARLGKQRVENLQIAHALTHETYAWQNHPAVRMWRKHELCFLAYQRAICDEWTNRGYIDTCLVKTRRVLYDAYADEDDNLLISRSLNPEWFGNEDIHRSHRSNLLRKDRAYYELEFEVDLPDNLEYVWPVPLDN